MEVALLSLILCTYLREPKWSLMLMQIYCLPAVQKKSFYKITHDINFII